MAKEGQKVIILPTLTFRSIFRDGRCTAMLAKSDGTWKVEVFATVEHAFQFARENGYAVTNRQERQ
jgi:hypothetical protein